MGQTFCLNSVGDWVIIPLVAICGQGTIVVHSDLGTRDKAANGSYLEWD